MTERFNVSGAMLVALYGNQIANVNILEVAHDE